MKSGFFRYAFFSISFVHLLSEFFGWSDLVFWSKPLLMPMLMLALWMDVSKTEINVSIRFAWVALFFSTAGDLFLLAEKNNNQTFYFYLGLGSFLLAQISYCLSFIRLGSLSMPTAWKIIYPLYFIGFILLLLPQLAAVLLFAVIIYGLALTLMAWNSWRTMVGKGWQSYAGIVGAMLFLISDSLLAINRFKSPVPYAGFWIMCTYIAAQYLIIQGIIIKSRSNFILRQLPG